MYLYDFAIESINFDNFSLRELLSWMMGGETIEK